MQSSTIFNRLNTSYCVATVWTYSTMNTMKIQAKNIHDQRHQRSTTKWCHVWHELLIFIYFEPMISFWFKERSLITGESCIKCLLNKKSRTTLWLPVSSHAANLVIITIHDADHGVITRHAKNLCHPLSPCKWGNWARRGSSVPSKNDGVILVRNLENTYFNLQRGSTSI